MVSGKLGYEGLQSHHLFSRSAYKELTFFYLNGIPIQESFHRLFHSMYGFLTTIDDFINFVDFLLLLENESLDKVQLIYLKGYLVSIQPLLYKELNRA